jgi:2-oxoglutarate dehydrogenase E1 component
VTTAPRAVTPSVNSWNAEYLEAQYAKFKSDPASVPADLHAFFRGFELGAGKGGATFSAASAGENASSFQAAVDELIQAYRDWGHLSARLDPFGRERPRPETLSLEYHGLSEADLDRPVHTGSVKLPDTATLRRVVEQLEETYCRHIGFEVTHVRTIEERNWLIDRVEQHRGTVPLTRGERAHILERLIRAEEFEGFLGRRYPGDKRFSLEGSESLIPLLEHLIEQAAALNIEEIVFGMAHRGRLNVLNNIMGKTYEQIFTEFEDNWENDPAVYGGDVKYHRGYSGERVFPSGRSIHVAMASNPSHLEAVGPVVLGRCRAKQRLRSDLDRSRVVPVLIHGDAAVAGQGVVAETLNMANLEGYSIGGTIHIVVNNLIGFTTSPEDGRSGIYATDIAKSIDAPVFHVNGEDPDSVVAAVQFAVEYRQRFKRDIFIDLYCYRKYGHNEQDEATFTQPLLYALIRKKPSVLKVYAERLLAEGVITEHDMQTIRKRLEDALNAAQEAARKTPFDPNITPASARWAGMKNEYSHAPANTAVSVEVLQEVCSALAHTPEGFNLNPKLKGLLDARGKLLETRAISYADAESLAYGSLLLEGTPVRLSGQDVRRGTFSHRHAVLRDVQTGEPYTPLNNMREVGIEGTADHPGTAAEDGRVRQARFSVYDSPLSEYAVLGFEYGYSLADPNVLVIWEAQFGDFVNGAQIMLDQFIASAEVKWERWSALTLLLPHGYEGAGPEHSSARFERFLQLCGNDNMQVIYPTTGPQIFHALRRQIHRSFRKPLVVMTPKSMLRTPTGTIDELITGRFQEVIDDPAFDAVPGRKGPSTRDVKRVILCTGKIYHELAERRDKVGRTDLAIVRVEQLYPLNKEMLTGILARYPKNVEIAWVQEEPRNAGAYMFMDDILRHQLGITATYIGRETSASPAVGSKTVHKYQQESILSRAVAPLSDAVLKGSAAPKAAKARATA